MGISILGMAVITAVAFSIASLLALNTLAKESGKRLIFDKEFN